MRNNFLIIVLSLGVIGVTAYAWGRDSVRAAGDLVVGWGVAEGEPIFTAEDMAPGDEVTAEVSVENVGTATRGVGVRGVETDLIGDVSELLNFRVEAQGGVVYGEGSGTGARTLQDFFNDSQDPDGIALTEVEGGDEAQLVFVASLEEEIGNDEQGEKVTFDITLGVIEEATEVPEECAGMVFDNIITGTSGSDSLRGTVGNDLIFGLEGSDSIRGRGGDDCLVGGAGSDSIRGNDGDDVLYGGSESDSLRGGNDNDILRGGDGSDSLRGGRGDDDLDGELGEDRARGNRGIDTCVAEAVRSCEA